MSPRLVVFGLIAAVLLAAALPISHARPSTAAVTPALSSHAPIAIIGDDNFTAANGVTGGDGTPADPYVISGWNITDAWPGDGIVVANTTAHLVVRDITITASYRDVEPEFPGGVVLINTSHVTVEEVTVLGNAYAFGAGGSSNVSFLKNVAVGNWVGLALTNSQDVLVQGNRFRGGDVPNPTTGMSVGITMGSCGVPVCPATRVTVVGNEITNNINGITVRTSADVTIYHNNFLNDSNPASTDAPNYSWDDGYPIGGNYWTGYAGVDVCAGPSQNICPDPDGIGDTAFTFSVGGVDRYPLMSPFVSQSFVVRPPIYIEGDANFTAANGVVGGSGTLTDPFVISGWQIDSATANAIDVRDTRANFVIRVVDVVDTRTAPPYNSAVYFSNVTGAEVEHLNVSSVASGFLITGSADVALAYLHQSSGTAMDLWLMGSHNVTVADSWFNGTGLFVGTSDNITVSANHLTGTQPGGVIKIVGTAHAVVDGNDIVSGMIRFNYTRNSSISNNLLAVGWILLGWGPTYNTTVTGNALGGLGYGIDAWQARDVLIGWNNVSSVGSYAVVFAGVLNGTVVGNRISDSGHGLFTEYSQGLQIYHNDLVGNTIQAANLSSNGVFWNASYPVGGNYWSDYSGVDVCSGPLQDNCTGGDGIGDTPYVIDSSDADAYPLMSFVGADTTPPSIRITSPAEGASFTSSPIDVAGTASDSGGSGLRDVELRANGGPWTEANGSTTWTLSVPLTPGANLLEARARDWAGNSATTQINVTHTPQPPPSNTAPVANFSWTPASGNTSTLFTFTSTSYDAQDSPAALQVRWDWQSDGVWDTSWSTTATATHTFAIAGMYNVTLEVKDAGGLTSSKTYALVVTNPPPPPPAALVATIGATPLEGPMPLTVSFTSAVSGGAAPYAYEWHFGDGSTSPSANAAHTYETTGSFAVSLTVRDSGGHDDVSNVLWVNVTVAGCPDCTPPPSFTPLIVFGAIVGLGAIAAAVAVIYVFRLRKPGPPG